MQLEFSPWFSTLNIFFCNTKLQNYLLIFERILFGCLRIVRNIFQKYEIFYHCFLRVMLNKLNSIYSITITSKVQLQSRKKTPSFQGVAFLSNKIFRFCEYYVFMFLCFQLT